jgi:hypothetical protein
MVLVYYPELGTIVNWEDVLSSEGQIVFPAGNPQGLAGLSLYASAGGEVLDAQGLPILDVDVLTRVLTLVQEGVSADVVPPSLANVTTEAQTLQIYRTGSAGTNKGIIWILNYRPSEDGTITPLPDWVKFFVRNRRVWARRIQRENQQLAVSSRNILEDEFIGEWTRQPQLPRALPQWRNDRTDDRDPESAYPILSNDAGHFRVYGEALTCLERRQPRMPRPLKTKIIFMKVHV